MAVAESDIGVIREELRKIERRLWQTNDRIDNLWMFVVAVLTILPTLFAVLKVLGSA